MADETLPRIEVKIINCDGKSETIYKDSDETLMNEIVQAIGKRNGVTISPLKKKGGGSG